VNFELTEDQIAILDALDRILSPYKSVGPSEVVHRFVYSAALQDSLADGGFLDLGLTESDASVTCALMIAEIAKLPRCVESVATALVRPAVCPEAQAPLAIIGGGASRPTRFLAQAKSALILDDQAVQLVSIKDGDVEEVESLFGYPMGRLKPAATARAKCIGARNVLEKLLIFWRIGVAMEIHGALQGAFALTIEHVTNRRQFGQPIGALQAVQHRLVMDATVIDAAKLLALKAAHSQTAADSALAAAYAQNAIATITYDLHQFSGAMGLTLEYALHLFTYRARALQSELGGAQRQFLEAATALWPQ
jgi:hypothetical protein